MDETHGMRYDPESGYVVLANVLSRDEVGAILAECDAIRGGPETELVPRDKLHSGTVHLEQLRDRVEGVAKLIRHTDLVGAVADIVGDNSELVQASLRCPQPAFGQQQLHTDDVPKVDDGPCRVATAVVALVPFTARNGATRIVPGSHRRVDLQRNPTEASRHLQEQSVLLEAGSAVVFSGHLVHSGCVNNSDADRPALHLTWHRRS